MEQAVKMFPSPVGELYFSIHFRFFIWGTRRVSVPCRGTIFLNTNWQMEKCTRLAFPSPVGELYFSISRTAYQSQRQRCFRPLSGNYISQSIYRRNAKWKNMVSVPCRGTIFLNPNTFISLWINCFRPLSGNYISQLLFECDGVFYLVSVPCRGTIFLNGRYDN